MSRDRRSSSYACAAAVFTLFSVSASWAQTPGPLNAITDVPGIEVGQYTSTDATSGGGTGTTVVVSRAGAVGGVSQRGGAPGTRETDLLRPENLVEKVNAVVLSGGSAYGLAAADGVMLCLEAQHDAVGGGQTVRASSTQHDRVDLLDQVFGAQEIRLARSGRASPLTHAPDRSGSRHDNSRAGAPSRRRIG